jgi:hypothetical protein
VTSRPHVHWHSRSAVVIAACSLLIAAITACSSSSDASSHTSEPPLGFRSPPSFLPTSPTPVDRVVTASAGHAQLAVQGVGVEVDLASGLGLVTVTGPQVPPFIAPPPPNVTATFDISLTHVSGTIPIRLTDFTITDQLGRTFEPTLVSGESPPPSSVANGATLDFQVNAVMPTGEGRLYWSPTSATPLVGWDFIVEND